MRFVSDLDGKEFTYQPNPVARAIAKRRLRLHIVLLLQDLGLPLNATYQVAKETYMSREEIRDLRRAGASIKDLAREYNITERRIDRWCGDIQITPTKPTRGALPRPVREAPDAPWLRRVED